jgi:D-alanyl-D-alanine carboxypeptidase
MTFPLKRIAVGLSRLAVAFLVVAAIAAPSEVDARSTTTKRAAPPSKARAAPKKVTRSRSAWVPNPAVSGKSAYLIVDATSGREISSDQADELRHPASLTKLMTIYLTFSALDSGRLALGDGLKVSSNALNAPPTKMGLTPGGTVSVRDATMALVTRSANDAAVVLAEALGGDEANFARMMTSKARQLGMTSTVYRNASGLPNREQVTTARDLARLASALMRDFPHYYAVFSVQSYTYRGRPLDNHNHMLVNYEGADGLKTGYTAASGFNLVLSAVRDNRRLIGVVMGGTSAGRRDRQMAELMDRGFASAQAMGISPWTSIRKPPSARYTASQFAPGIPIQETPRAVAKAEARPPAAPADTADPALGSWVIQVGSFNEPQAAQVALERASAALPNNLRSTAAATVDEVQMASKVFHRARLTNLSQEQAISGCKRLEKQKIYCSPLQVTAWNTPGAR